MNEQFSILVDNLKRAIHNDEADYSFNNLREVSVNEFMLYKAGQWIRPVIQGAHRIHSEYTRTPVRIQSLLHTDIQDCGMLDIFSDGTCYFITRDYCYQPITVHGQSFAGAGEWVPKFFMFDVCNHNYVGAQVGRCLNKYVCSKCGHAYTIDSGD